MANIQDNPRGAVLVTSKNLEWASQVTGKTRERIEEMLEEATQNDCVCIVPIDKNGRGAL